MEWVSYLAGERHTSEPVCVSEMLGYFCIELNDNLPDRQRQKLRPYLARAIGTAGDGLDRERAMMAAEWLIGVNAPTWLSLAGLDAAVERLHTLSPLLTVNNLGRAMEDLNCARHEAFAARAAAKAAVGNRAWAAAKAAAKDAARAAMSDVAFFTMCMAPADDAVDGVGDDSWEAELSARQAIEVARSAAWAAAKTSAWRAAAGSGAPLRVATAALAPTVAALQGSALTLLDRMLPTVPSRLPVATDPDALCAIG
jgi:hypothetical protein